MTAITELSETFTYDAHAHDFTAWWAHHRELVAAMEPAQWPSSRYRYNGALFTDVEVVEIRELYATREYTLDDLAEAFGCVDSTIGFIVNGKTYTDVGGPRTHIGVGNNPPSKRLSA